MAKTIKYNKVNKLIDKDFRRVVGVTRDTFKNMVKVSAIQMSMSEDKDSNIAKAQRLVKESAKNGAKIILLPELFEGVYFCKDMDKKYFSWAKPKENNPLLNIFSSLAKELDVVLLISYFEKAKSLGNKTAAKNLMRLKNI